jgi:hypothetical protein
MSCQKTVLEESELFIARQYIAGQKIVRSPETNVEELDLKKDVPLQGFYKDIFMDAGVHLTTRNKLAAATYLGYSLESVSCSEIADTAWQNTIIAGDATDTNGRLLYPDGQPRYRMIFVCGGNSRTHGQSLRPSCLNRMRDFVRHGGSYVGTCAGAFFATKGYDSIPNYPYYLALWPGTMNHTGLSGTYTGMFVNEDSPLLRYYDFGGDHYIADVRHNKGGYPTSIPVGTEVLARYDYPDKEDVHEQPSAWAYKPSSQSGRIIMEGSHPEEVKNGERRDFTAAMLRYAVDGVGQTTVKGILRNGEPWIINKKTEDGDPSHTMIGDMQYHHFVVSIPNDVKDLTISLASSVDCDLQLLACIDTYAYADVAEFISELTGSTQQLVIPFPHAGLWYIAVRSHTTVTSTDVPLGQEYTGRTDVLNGVPYTITASWTVFQDTAIKDIHN